MEPFRMKYSEAWIVADNFKRLYFGLILMGKFARRRRVLQIQEEVVEACFEQIKILWKCKCDSDTVEYI